MFFSEKQIKRGHSLWQAYSVLEGSECDSEHFTEEVKPFRAQLGPPAKFGLRAKYWAPHADC